MHFVEAVSVVIPSVLASAMANTAVFITPSGKPAIDVVLVGVNGGPRGNRRLEDRLDRFLLNVRQHSHHDLATPLNHAEDGGLFFLERTTAAGPFQTTAAAFSPFFCTAAGWPLWPATM